MYHSIGKTKIVDKKGKGKGKVVSVLPLTEHHAMKACWGVEVQLHPFFDLCTRRR
jgi:hypothetical protein